MFEIGPVQNVFDSYFIIFNFKYINLKTILDLDIPR